MGHLSGWDRQGGVPCLRRSGYAQAGRHFAVLTYSMYAPRVKQRGGPPRTLPMHSRPCWTDFFEHSLQLMVAVSSWVCVCLWSEIFNSPPLKEYQLKLSTLAFQSKNHTVLSDCTFHLTVGSSCFYRRLVCINISNYSYQLRKSKSHGSPSLSPT